MARFRNWLDELKLNRHELKELIQDAQSILDGMIPFYIKDHYKKCGKHNCWCVDGLGHGPYVYVVYSEHGKQRQKSLGAKATNEEIEAIYNQRRPDWMDFIVTGKTLKKALADSEKSKELQQRYLNPIDFERFYGLPKDEDGLNRPDHLYYNYAEFEKAIEAYEEQRILIHSPWSRYGIITHRGQSVLNSLIDRGFYLAY